jgi:hypothetical protein
MTIPVPATAVREFGSLSLADLTASFYERQYRARTYRGEHRRKAKDDLEKIEAEFQVRGIPVPEPDRLRRPKQEDAEERAR